MGSAFKSKIARYDKLALQGHNKPGFQEQSDIATPKKRNIDQETPSFLLLPFLALAQQHIAYIFHDISNQESRPFYYPASSCDCQTIHPVHTFFTTLCT
jgi:hypothetical protein